MALSLSSGVKDKVAYLLYTQSYSGLGVGPRQSLIDGEGASALTEIEQYAQWFTFTSATGNAPDEWEPWFVTKIVARIQGNAHPAQADSWQAKDDRAMVDAMTSYARRAINYNPNGLEAFVYNVMNNRMYVLNHCIRRPRGRGERPFLPTTDSVDAALDEVLNQCWTGTQWHFARRPVRITFTRTAFTGMSYTDSTKTLTTTGVSTTLPLGARLYITGGTGATTGEYAVQSTTATTMVLSSSIGSSADGQTDIAGFYVVPTYHGLNTGETIQSIANVRFNYTDAGNESQELVWITSDDYAKVRAIDNTGTGRPKWFRTHMPNSTTPIFCFSPPPDTDYTVFGEVLVNRAASPTSSTDTVPFAMFAAEFMPGIRRAQLDRVLTNFGRTDHELHRQVTAEFEEDFPRYSDIGDPDTQEGVRDVYRDRISQRWPYNNMIGDGI